jgi:beta-N-acetylhexosaminidase
VLSAAVPSLRRWFPTRRAAATLALSGALLAVLAACVPVPTGGARGVLSRMTLEQRIGQLFMVGTPATGVDPAVAAQIADRHIGNVVLTGRTYAGITPTANVTNRLQLLTTQPATAGVPLFVAADQEGGYVQVVNGPGLSPIPTALAQGSLPSPTLRLDAGAWGRQLRAAGVNVDLGPVLDTVPGPGTYNPPIGAYQREFGYTPQIVADKGSAVVRGLVGADVAATIKHFPGLGRVSANTDTTAGVTDTVTTRGDAYLAPFAAGIASGAQFVMMSTAYYSSIDPANPAAFSPTIINTVLRGDLRFRGVVISDDLGGARQVTVWTPAQRALQFFASGGDMLLTVDPSVVPQMYDTVLAYAKVNPRLRAMIDQAALRVLTAKQERGLIRP